MKKKLLWLLAVIVVAAAIIIAGSFYLLDYALNNADRQHDRTFNRFNYAIRTYPEVKPWLDSLASTNALRDTFITMPSGERQHAIFVRSNRAKGRTAILIHGYKDQATGMIQIARIYNKELGFNILLPDLHAHGESDGNDIRMGWKDRNDILHWAKVAEQAFRYISPDRSRMVLHGISMGAATTMCVSGENTPDYIKCFVEDCGYTSVWDEYVHELKGRFHLPPFPLLYTSSFLCDMKYGWSFTEASPVTQVAKCHKPMLFIHGSNDDFVPTEMVYPCYNAKPRPKELWIAPGSAHAMSYKDHKNEYIHRVCNFVNRWL